MIKDLLKGVVSKSLPDANTWQTIIAIIINKEADVENTIRNIAMESLQTEMEVVQSLKRLMTSGYQMEKTKSKNLLIYIGKEKLLIKIAKQAPKQTGSMEMFVSHGGSAKVEPPPPISVSPEDKNTESLIISIMAKNLDEIDETLKSGSISFDYTNSAGDNILAVACKKSDINILLRLMEYGLSAQDGLMWACQNGNRYKGLIALFIKHGASPDSGDGLVPLQWAIFTGAVGIAQELISGGANVDFVSESGESILQMAVDSDNEQLVELLILNNVNLNIKDANNNTPLHWAVTTGAEDIIKMLIFNKADTKAQNSDGKTPKELATALGQDKASRVLNKY